MKKKVLGILLVFVLAFTIVGAIEDTPRVPEGRSILDWITNAE